MRVESAQEESCTKIYYFKRLPVVNIEQKRKKTPRFLYGSPLIPLYSVVLVFIVKAATEIDNLCKLQLSNFHGS